MCGSSSGGNIGIRKADLVIVVQGNSSTLTKTRYGLLGVV